MEPQGPGAGLVVSPEVLRTEGMWLRESQAPNTATCGSGADKETRAAAHGLRGYGTASALAGLLEGWGSWPARQVKAVLAEADALQGTADAHGANDRASGDRLGAIAVAPGSGHRRSALDGY
ncbi:hypothetical protein SRB5_21010 [Streptomyces sp. RB5]|uniref:Uncharacterized protein n=1 Tax=Streptomyces smaragdinus TaxID=2585196 RepID=A0A7K0CF37_9ACTN|nr:hypothetical protein [Streptomyces smaragdinus]MQY11973.1 hypothetical protein [Streptomyces smaragdinus]